MTPTEIKTLAETALDDMKAIEVTVIDVADRTTVTDWMIVAGGTSQRHVKSLASEVIRLSKESGVRPVGIEGETEGDWILVDLGDVIVHVMTRETRDFYALEKLWTMEPTDLEAAQAAGRDDSESEAIHDDNEIDNNDVAAQ